MANKFISFSVTAVAVVSLSVAPFVAPVMAQEFMGENFSCDSIGSDLSRIIENSKPPESAGLIVQLQNLMWMLQAGLNWLDSNCRNENGYAQTRASWNNSLTSTRNACFGMATNSGDCRPVRYR